MRKRPGSKGRPTNRGSSPQSVTNLGVREAQAVILQVLSELAARGNTFVNELGWVQSTDVYSDMFLCSIVVLGAFGLEKV